MIKDRQAWVKLAIGSNYYRFKYYMHVSKLIKRKQYKNNNINKVLYKRTTLLDLWLKIIVIKLPALLCMSNKIIGKNYPLSFILVNGYI
jgi:hypothetical protein